MFKQDEDEKNKVFEERIRKANQATAEARRRRDTHVKCAVAGELFRKLKIYNIALNLASKEEQETFLQYMQEHYFARLKYNDETVKKFSMDCKEAVEKAAKQNNLKP